MGFAGTTFSPELDGPRLATQFERVLALMQDGRWRTLGEIARAVGGSEAGVSARLRELRTKDAGGHTVLKHRVGDPSKGLWKYALVMKGQMNLWGPRG